MVRHFGLVRRGKAFGVGLGKAARRFVRVRGETGLRRAEASLPALRLGGQAAGRLGPYMGKGKRQGWRPEGLRYKGRDASQEPSLQSEGCSARIAARRFALVRWESESKRAEASLPALRLGGQAAGRLRPYKRNGRRQSWRPEGLRYERLEARQEPHP
jgi:hypothetical protein